MKIEQSVLNFSLLLFCQAHLVNLRGVQKCGIEMDFTLLEYLLSALDDGGILFYATATQTVNY